MQREDRREGGLKDVICMRSQVMYAGQGRYSPPTCSMGLRITLASTFRRPGQQGAQQDAELQLLPNAGQPCTRCENTQHCPFSTTSHFHHLTHTHKTQGVAPSQAAQPSHPCEACR